MTKATVILPKKKPFDVAKMRGVITSTLNATAKNIKIDFCGDYADVGPSA